MGFPACLEITKLVVENFSGGCIKRGAFDSARARDLALLDVIG